MKLNALSLKKLSFSLGGVAALSICYFAYTFVAAPDDLGVSNQTEKNVSIQSKNTPQQFIQDEQNIVDINPETTIEQKAPAPDTTQPQEQAPSKVVSSFGDGTHLVEVDITPGTYQTTNPSSNCQYEKLSRTLNSSDRKSIKTNGNSEAKTTIVLSPDDSAFMTMGCGTWKKTN